MTHEEKIKLLERIIELQAKVIELSKPTVNLPIVWASGGTGTRQCNHTLCGSYCTQIRSQFNISGGTTYPQQQHGNQQGQG